MERASLPHDREAVTPDHIERQKQLDELFAESDRQIARILFQYMETEDGASPR